MFLFNLPTDTDENENADKKIGENIKDIVGKKRILITGVLGLLLVIFTFTLGVIGLNKPPKNASPYCLFTREQGKICKIHNKKHTSDKLSALVVSDDEMALHQQLYEEVSKGAYFDGKKLYKKEDAKEILSIKDEYSKEKASLFEKYLADTLTAEEKERYNFIIEELDTLEQCIKKLGIRAEEKDEPSKDELKKEIEELKAQLDEAEKEKNAEISMPAESTAATKTDSTKVTVEEPAKEETKQNEDKLIYINKSSKSVNIPKDIEKAATIKKSSLYN